MSPNRAGSNTIRDNLIRRLTPFIMTGLKLKREQAYELLASLSPDERHLLYALKAKALNFQKINLSTRR